MKAVVCKFEGYGREYTFLLDPSLSVAPGDQVVAEAAGKLSVVTVTSVLEVAPKIATKWAFLKVDPSRLEALKDWHMRRDQIEQSRRSIVSKLNRKIAERSDMERFMELAKTDPDAAALLKDLTELGCEIEPPAPAGEARP
jgi:hypothetical protein